MQEPENSNSRRSNLGAQCKFLNLHLFLTLEDAREKLENWRRHRLEGRPHSAIEHMPSSLRASIRLLVAMVY
nr:integrase core domain-containing protein [Brucella anthropi]